MSRSVSVGMTDLQCFHMRGKFLYFVEILLRQELKCSILAIALSLVQGISQLFFFEFPSECGNIKNSVRKS